MTKLERLDNNVYTTTYFIGGMRQHSYYFICNYHVGNA